MLHSLIISTSMERTEGGKRAMWEERMNSINNSNHNIHIVHQVWYIHQTYRAEWAYVLGSSDHPWHCLCTLHLAFGSPSSSSGNMSNQLDNRKLEKLHQIQVVSSRQQHDRMKGHHFVEFELIRQVGPDIWLDERREEWGFVLLHTSFSYQRSTRIIWLDRPQLPSLQLNLEEREADWRILNGGSLRHIDCPSSMLSQETSTKSKQKFKMRNVPGNMTNIFLTLPAQLLNAPAPPSPTWRSNWLPATSLPVLIDWTIKSRSIVSTLSR